MPFNYDILQMKFGNKIVSATWNLIEYNICGRTGIISFHGFDNLLHLRAL